MRITDLHVDGYGTLADFSLHELPAGLTVILGANEAGKSTLLDFLRGVLFGFPDRRQRRPYHEPLHGGRHGGSLRLLDDAGRQWSLERYVDTRRAALTGPDGAPVDERELTTLLGGADDGLFRSVFAFGLTELAAFDSLDTDEVRDLVFSAGVLGAGRSATRAARALEQSRVALIRQRQADAQANQLRARLEAVDGALDEARHAADGYRGAAAEGERLRAALEAARHGAEDLHRRGLELERIVSSWPIARRAEDTLTALDALGEEKPADAVVREAALDIRRLAAGLSGHEERWRRRAELTLTAGAIASEREAHLRAAGLDPSGPAPSIDAADEAQANELAREDRERRAELAGLVQHESLARREHDQVAADLALEIERRPARRAVELREAAAALGEVREALAETERRRTELEADQREVARAELARTLSHGPGAERLVIVLGAFGLAALGIVLATRAGVPLGLRVATMVVCALVLVLAWASLRRHNAPTAAGSARPNGAREALALSESRLRELALRTGLGDAVSPLRLAAAERDLEAERDSRARIDELAWAERRAAERVERAVAATKQGIAARDAVLDAVRSCGSRLGLGPRLDAEALVRALASLRRASEAAGDAARIDDEVTQLDTAITAFSAALEDVERRLDVVFDGRAEVGARIERLEERLDAAIAQHDARRRLESALEDARRLLDEAIGSGAQAEALREELASGSLLAWEQERQLLAGQIAAADATCDSALQALHEHERALHDLAMSSEIATLEMERESLTLALDEALARWLVLSHAKALLEETLASYERDRQPAVIARASELFAAVTDGRYLRLVAREDHDNTRRRGIDALGPNGERVDSAQLSRGTAEQLYLCLRLAFASTFAARAVSLPVVLDDVLVNFDPDRASAVAHAVAKTAEDHQVLAFTCHPHVVEHFFATGVPVRVVELPGSRR